MSDMRPERILANIFLVLISISFSFTLLELAFQVYLWRFADGENFDIYASVNQFEERYGDDRGSQSQRRRYSPHRYLEYAPNPDFRTKSDRHNVLGFRGDEISIEKPRGVFRIVCLGGSTTYSTKVNDYKKSYPYLLQKYLRDEGFELIEVVNAGVAGYSSWESVINFQFRVLDLEPDMIIVYHGINDVHSRLVYPPSAYRGDNSGARMVANAQIVKMPSIWEYSTLLRTIMIKLGKTQSHNSLEWRWGAKSPTFYGNLFIDQQRKGIYPQSIFEDVSAMSMFDNNPPIYFERNLDSIIAIAQANEIEVILATFAYSPLFTEEPMVSSAEYIKELEESNEIIRKFELKAHVYDFAKEMPKDKIYYVDGMHFTELGNTKRAELFAKYLIGLGEQGVQLQ